MIDRIIRWVMTVKRETLVVLFLVSAFFAIQPILRFVDPTTAVLDGGYLHVAILGVLKVFAALMGYGITLFVAFRSFYHYAAKPSDLGDGKGRVTAFRRDWLSMDDAAARGRVYVFVGHSVVIVSMFLIAMS